MYTPERMSSNCFNLVCNLSEDTSPSSKLCLLSSRIVVVPWVVPEISYNEVITGLSSE
jgi:hypothetical protein